MAQLCIAIINVRHAVFTNIHVPHFRNNAKVITSYISYVKRYGVKRRKELTVNEAHMFCSPCLYLLTNIIYDTSHIIHNSESVGCCTTFTIKKLNVN